MDYGFFAGGGGSADFIFMGARIFPKFVYLRCLGIRKGGGRNVSCDFGGGKRTIKHPLQNQSRRPQKVGFLWSVPVSSKENDIA